MKDAMFDELMDSIREAGSIRRGEKEASRTFAHAEPDVKRIRAKTRLSQAKFAVLIGVSPRTLQNWEQGHRHPTGPARALLTIVDSDPEAALKALRFAGS